MPIFKDVTRKYDEMIEAFNEDFEIAKKKHVEYLVLLQDEINNGNEIVLKDIELLKELSSKIGNGKVKIVECEVKR